MSDVTNVLRPTKGIVFWLVAALVGLLVAFAVVLALTWGQTVQVTAPSQLKALRFGWPVGWVTQDRSSAYPQLPRGMSMGSPWEHPVTDVRWVALGVNVSAFLLPLLVVVYAVRGSVRRAAEVNVEHQRAA
jgi:hypothetical protein